LEDTKYIIADNVKLYRKKENLTQMELAERAELSLDSIKRVESGKKTMSLENFLRLTEALCVSLPFLLYDQKNGIPDEERIRCIFEGKDDKQKEYLLHMLQEMSDGLEKLG